MSMRGILIRLTEDEVGSLRDVAPEEAVARIAEWRTEDGRAFELGQLWQAIHVALTGMPDDDGVEGPLGFIGADYGEVLGADYGDDMWFAYGPAVLLDCEATAAIAKTVAALPDDVVAMRLKSDVLNEVYPYAPGSADEGDRARIAEVLRELRTFVSETAAKGMCMIKGID